MSEDMAPRFDRVEPFQRGADETADEYEAFVEFVRIPVSSRSHANLARRTGLPINFIHRAAKKNSWLERAGAFDLASEKLRPDAGAMEEEASRAAQLAAATILQELGSLSISMKNPAHIKTSDALRMMEKGIEIQRRALGEADITVSVKQENAERIAAMAEEILELEADDVEVVAEDRDGDGSGEDHEGQVAEDDGAAG